MYLRFLNTFFLTLIISVEIAGSDFSNNLGKQSQVRIQNIQDIPENDVQTIFRDSRGFMWLGTLDGLHRYDGWNLKTYRPGNNVNSISSNMIIDIDEDTLGNIWIGTYGKGIGKLNPFTQKFTSYLKKLKKIEDISKDVTCLLVDNTNTVWIANWFGLIRIRFDERMEKVTDTDLISVDQFPNTASNEVIKAIQQDKKGNIWIGTITHVYLLKNPYENPEKFNFTSFEVKAESICDYKDGVLTGGNDIYYLKYKNGKLKATFIANHYTLAILHHNSVIWAGNRAGITCFEQNKYNKWVETRKFSKNFSEQSIGSNIITALSKDINNQIWVGTRGGGVSVINSKPKRFEHYSHSKTEGSLGNNLVRCIFEDHNENLWIGTEENGMSLLRGSDENSYSSGFRSITVNDDPYQNRVYAVEEFFTPESDQHKSLIFAGTSYPTNLAVFDPETLEKKKLPEFINSIGFVFSIERTNDSTLWLGTYGNGLWKFTLDKKGNIIRKLSFTPDIHSKTTISSYIIRSIFKDSKNNLWIGTDKGLNKIEASELNKPSPEITRFSEDMEECNIPHDYILQIIESKTGKLWMGTMGGGLIGYEEDNSEKGYRFSSITTEDGLPNNTIKSIVEDKDGYLWLASNNGLTRFNPHNGNMINYNKNHGLQANEFSEIAAIQRKNGQMVFGGVNGINVFYPSQIGTDTIQPKMFITDFYIGNQQIHTGDSVNGRILLSKSIEFTDQIHLKYKENSFSLGFVGLQYNVPEKNKYKYKLEGFDDRWYNIHPQQRIAKYTNIPEGKYTFKVLGSNSDNVWSDEPATINIIIDPPFSRSQVAMALYLLGLALITFIFIKVSRIISNKKRDLLIANIEKNKIEELSQLKQKFFTNISHEFRTPLTLISSPIEKLLNDQDNLPENQKRRYYVLIRKNVDLLLRLINQLMDFTKLDKNKLTANISPGNINAYIYEIFENFRPLADQKQINLTFNPFSKNLIVDFDPDKLEKIVYNLLSNAFKFTPEKGKIDIIIDEDVIKKQAIISVKDNGKGIDREKLPFVFNRFYREDDTSTSSKEVGGTGIGLAFSKGLAELQNGTLTAESSKGKGSVFSIHLPLSGNEFSPVSEEESNFRSSKNNADEASRSLTNNEETTQELKEEIKERSYKVLFIEDNQELREHIKEIFENTFEIFGAENGINGLEVCREIQPDIVVSDVMMPQMNGIEFCHTLKTEESISHIPVILLTAKDSIESQVEGFKTGADAYVTKPFSTKVLQARIISIIQNREKLKRIFQHEIKINPSIISKAPADSKFLDKIIGFIEQNLSNAEYTVEQLAEDYGVSRIYLNRKIKALTGETSNQFLRNIRLKHAAEMLKQSNLNVSEVTWEVGYNDLKTFRTRFKEKFGISPSDFAKQYREE